MLLAEGLLARGHRVDIVVFSGERNPTWKIPDQARLFLIQDSSSAMVSGSFVRPEYRIRFGEGLRSAIRLFRSVREARFLLRRSTMRHARGIADYIAQQRPEFIFPNIYRAEYFAFLACRLVGDRTPFIVPIVHGTLELYKKRQNEVRRFLFPAAARIVTVSNGVAEIAATVLNMPRKMFTPIYNPVVGNHSYEPLPPPDHPWFFDGGPPIILTVGNLFQYKDHTTLIKEFDILRKTCSYRLIILGGGARDGSDFSLSSPSWASMTQFR